MTSKALLIVTTCGSEESATLLAKNIVQNKLAACVHIFPKGRSYYMWQGEMNSDEEWTLLIKSQHTLYEDIEQAIKSQHSYQIPEILAWDIEQGYPPYLEWLFQNTTKDLP